MEYIAKKDALAAIDEAIELSCYDYQKIEDAINACKTVDVKSCEAMGEYIIENILSLKEWYSSTCCMCSKGVCDDCNINSFADKLSDIIKRASERKEG